MTRAVLVVNAAKADAAQIEALRRETATAFAVVGWPEPGLLLTTRRDPGGGQARAALRGGAQLVVACGGDGTVNAVADVLADTGIPLGIVALGTGNLLAANLGIPTPVGEALEVLTTGVDRPIDLGRSGGQVFAGIAGLGLDAAMVADAPAWLKKRVGWPAYLVSIARHVGDRGFRVTLELDGRRVRRAGVRTLLIGNVGRVQGGLALLPQAEPDDGLLDVVVLAPRGRVFGWLTVLTRLLTGTDRHTETVSRYRVRHIVARTSRPVDRELDGEPLVRATVLEAQVLPHALLVRVPRAPEHDPSGAHAAAGQEELSRR